MFGLPGLVINAATFNSPEIEASGTDNRQADEDSTVHVAAKRSIYRK
jgi:hypothetical protein